MPKLNRKVAQLEKKEEKKWITPLPKPRRKRCPNLKKIRKKKHTLVAHYKSYIIRTGCPLIVYTMPSKDKKETKPVIVWAMVGTGIEMVYSGLERV